MIILNEILSLALMILLGILLTKLGYLNEEVQKKLAAMLLKVILPLYVINAFQLTYDQTIIRGIIITAISSFIIISLGLIISKVIFAKLPKNYYPTARFAFSFPNCGYIGFPLIGSLYGKEAILYVSIFLLVYMCMMWTAGIRLFSKEAINIKSLATNPGILSVLIGLILFLTQIQLPYFITNTFAQVGSMVSPIAMLLIGAFISKCKLKDVFTNKTAYVISIFRLIILPVIIMFFLKLFNVDDPVLFNTIIIISAMPAATNTILLVVTYKADAKFASISTSLSTLLSLLTLPMWVYFLI